MKPLHSWNVSVEQAIQIQEALKDRIILKKTFSKVHPFRNSSRCDSKPSRALAAQALAQRVKPCRNYSGP